MNKNNIKYEDQKYIVNNQQDFTLSEALRLWRAKFPEFVDFKKDVIVHPNLEDFGNFVESVWNDIKPVTVEEALQIPNTEIRRTYFDCIGVVQLFKSLNPKLRDRQVITKKRTGWDDDNKEIVRTFEDVYELYEIEGKKLFPKDRWGRAANPVFAVRCWCTTTTTTTTTSTTTTSTTTTTIAPLTSITLSYSSSQSSPSFAKIMRQASWRSPP